MGTVKRPSAFLTADEVKAFLRVPDRLSAIPVTGVLFMLGEKRGRLHLHLGYVERVAPLLFVMVVACALCAD